MGVLIVGAGIAGLTAAVALRRAGIDATVYERLDDVAAAQIGAGLNLGYNATRVLRHLGLLEEVLAAGCPLERFEFEAWGGKRLTAWPVPDQEVQLGVTRRALHGILVGRLPREALVCGKTLVRYEDGGSSVTAVFSDGTTASGSLLLGADGLRSTVRAQAADAKPPRYVGFSVLRTLVQVAGDPPLPAASFRHVWGRGASSGMYWVGPDLVYVFGWSKAPEGERVPPGSRREAFLERYGSSSPAVAALVEACEEEAIHQTDIYDRPPLRTWGAGRVSLAGDAAHPMTFNVGQGACQAIEDAAVLARVVASGGERPEALRRYERERAGRAASFMRQSAKVGSLSVVDNPLACRIRNLLLRTIAKRAARGKRLMVDVAG